MNSELNVVVQKPECQLQTLERLASCKLRLRKWGLVCPTCRRLCLFTGQYDGALNVYMRIFSETKGKDGINEPNSVSNTVECNFQVLT